MTRRGPTQRVSAADGDLNSSSFNPVTCTAPAAAAKSTSGGIEGAPGQTLSQQQGEHREATPSAPRANHGERSQSPASAGSLSSDTPSRSSAASSRLPFSRPGASGSGNRSGGNPLTSGPSIFTSTQSASASSSNTSARTSSTAGNANPSVPITVNAPLPTMHLPNPLPLSNRSRPKRGSTSSRSQGATSQSSLDPAAFNFSTLLSDLLRDPNAAADLDAIAEICGRSRLSRANEYTAHREPVGPGAGSTAASGPGGTAPSVGNGGVRIAGDGEEVEYAGEDGDGSLHASLMTHFPTYHGSAGVTGLAPVEEASETQSEVRSLRRSSALDIFSGDRRRGSPGRASPSVGTADDVGTGLLSGSGDEGTDAERTGQRAVGRLRWLAGSGS